MNVDATYTIEIDGHKLALTHAQAKELYRKLGALIGNGFFSEIGRYSHGPYTVPCSNPEEPWKLPPVTCDSGKVAYAPTGIPLGGLASSAHLANASNQLNKATLDQFAPIDCIPGVAQFSGSSHTTT